MKCKVGRNAQVVETTLGEMDIGNVMIIVVINMWSATTAGLEGNLDFMMTKVRHFCSHWIQMFR